VYAGLKLKTLNNTHSNQQMLKKCTITKLGNDTVTSRFPIMLHSLQILTFRIICSKCRQSQVTLNQGDQLCLVKFFSFVAFDCRKAMF
jgi:hypothetical protein